MAEQTDRQTNKQKTKLKITRIVIVLYETDKNSKWVKNNQRTDTFPLQIYLYIVYIFLL